MDEIGGHDRPKLITFLKENFEHVDENRALTPTEQGLYADIAILLSNEDEMLVHLKKISDQLEEFHNRLESRFGELGEDAWPMGARGTPNLIGKSIMMMCGALGWDVEHNLQLMEPIKSDRFIPELVRRGRMFRDHIAATHGAFSHCLQWLTVYSAMGRCAPDLYKKSGAFYSTRTFFTQGRGAPAGNEFLWVFLADCVYRKTLDSEWTECCRSGTCRSPTGVTKLLVDRNPGNLWLGNRLKEQASDLGQLHLRTRNVQSGDPESADERRSKAREMGFEPVSARNQIYQRIEPSLGDRFDRDVERLMHDVRARFGPRSS